MPMRHTIGQPPPAYRRAIMGKIIFHASGGVHGPLPLSALGPRPMERAFRVDPLEAMAAEEITLAGIKK